MNNFPRNSSVEDTSLYQRFCLYVYRKADHQCWPWIGASRGTTGYGQLTEWRNKKRITHSPHRLAWEFCFGPIPSGLLIRHMCHNRVCCNPSHLLLGTAKDNFNDKINAKREGNSVMLSGEDNRNAKLTCIQVEEIRQTKGQTIYKTAIQYGVSKSLISEIKRNKIWQTKDQS